ncbi:MAG: BlaI/MecI/CopY family transcriptional regulator [Planctomycetes bacterium]|nr:BlaI/MecI/CopY family transcriptional regulator [Planctomycetota bacterium]
MSQPGKKPLGPLEHAVMQILWDRQQATSDEVRKALPQDQEFKESTIRTILRRLEEKQYLRHDVEGRTYVYRPRVKPESVASRQVLGIIDKLCKGSVENLLVGMVDDELITPEKLRELADRISMAEAQQKSTSRKARRKPKK